MFSKRSLTARDTIQADHRTAGIVNTITHILENTMNVFEKLADDAIKNMLEGIENGDPEAIAAWEALADIADKQ